MLPRTRKPKRTVATGDCYEAAGKYIVFESDDDDLVLVHAEVMGQGPLEGATFGHGFVIDQSLDFVIDKSNGRNIKLPRMLYYAIGHIEEIGNYHEYTREEAREKMLKYGHYGPWDLKTSTGL